MKRYKLEVCLEMDAENPPWDYMWEFEKSFSDFLAAHGVQAEKIQYPEGASNELSLYLTPIEESEVMIKQQSAPSTVLNKIQIKDYGKPSR